ncbi:MAG TPA: DUF6132 family protein [Candidatus Kapabacteria bacterium]|nr:DUF6132 family protein [Candidatus Kapabacteria bacterium]
MNFILKYKIVLIAGLVGGILGYSYYYFIGCNSGTCPITSNWHISTLYGMLIGVVAFFPSKSKRDGVK